VLSISHWVLVRHGGMAETKEKYILASNVNSYFKREKNINIIGDII